MKIVKIFFKIFLRKGKKRSNTREKATLKMMQIRKFLAFFLTLYTAKTNCDMLNEKAIYQTMCFVKSIVPASFAQGIKGVFP